MKLSVIICAFNEVATIETLINKVVNINLINKINKEIIIIDNNSTDGTKKVLKKFENINYIKIFYQKENLGKGTSIIKGVKEATGEYIIFQDADLEYEPSNYNKLLSYLINNNLDAVYGSRSINNTQYHVYHLNKLAVVMFTKLINLFFNTSFTDTATNHKLIKSKIIKTFDLKSKSFAIDFEVSIKLGKGGFKCGEVPINFKPRTYKEGKKIGVKDGFKCLCVIIYHILKN